ncbi:MAG: hypothetical protein IPM13_12195 [Phycisphaerales bacterium]|nr:hypothetical protein [Phycisphaerales bacterium]
MHTRTCRPVDVPELALRGTAPQAISAPLRIQRGSASAGRRAIGTMLAALLALTCAAPAVAAPARFDGYVVARVTCATEDELARVIETADELWSCAPAVGDVDVMFAPDRLDALRGLGLPYTIWVQDVQALIDGERAAAPRTWFEDYHPYDELVAYLSQLCVDHPTLAQMVNIGTSLEGRTIWGIRIAAPDLDPLAPGVLYFCGQHAREWITTMISPYVATHLLANYGTDPVVTDLVNRVEWFLVPVVNPDGYEHTWTTYRLWRKNRRDNGNGTFGVDLNRNWGYGWGSNTGSSGLPSSETYRGPAPFSEPETQALRDFLLAHPNVRAMNDVHSYSQLILWPWGYTSELPADQAAFSAVGTAMRQLILAVHNMSYTAGPVYSTIYPVSGGSVDWAYGARGIFAFSFELRDKGQYGFILPASQIIPNCEEILPALLHLTDSDPVRATRISLPAGRPAALVAGQDTPIEVTITSGDDTLLPATATLHYRYDPSGPFIEVPLTQLAGARFEAVLPATNCTSLPQYYFSITGSAGTTFQPPDAPQSLYDSSMVSGLTVFSDDLSTNPGWATEGLWAWGQPLGGGGSHGFRDPNSGYTGLNVYGYNLAGDYTNNMPERHLTTTAIDCSRQYGLRLSFWRWLGVERAPYDRAQVRVSSDYVNWTTIWENPTTETADNKWTYQDFDISALADNRPTVYIRWTMGPTDSGWTYCGWNIDDVAIYATGCETRPGDYNGDGQLGLSDALAFDGCLLGAGNGIGPTCGILDMDSDNDVDIADYAAFQTAFTGP